MLTPTFRSAGAWSFTASNVPAGPTLSPSAPAGVVAGDLLIVVSESRSNSATASCANFNIVSGFPKRSATTSGGTIYVWTRIADGSANDAPAVVWASLTSGTSGDSTGAGILCYQNLLETLDGTVQASDLSGQGATSVIPAFTTGTNGSMVFGIAMKILESAGQTSTVATFTERVDNLTASGTGHTVSVSELLKASAGSSGTATVTWSATTSARALTASLGLKAAPSRYTKVGAVTCTGGGTATLDYQLHRGIVGAVTVTGGGTATLAFARHYAIVASVTGTATPVATLLFTTGSNQYAIVGAVTVTGSGSATLDFTRHAALVGGVTMTTTPAATMQIQRHRVIVGALTSTATPTATLAHQIHPAILGAVSCSATPVATLSVTRHPAIVGAVSAVVSGTATLSYTIHPALVGTLTVTASLAATLLKTQHPVLVGAITTSATPASTLDFQQHASLVGALTVASSVDGVMTFLLAGGHAIIGHVTAAALPTATLTYTQHPAILGAVTLTVTVAATLSKARHVALVGDVLVNATAAATLVYGRPTQHAAIVGTISVSTTLAALLGFATRPDIVQPRSGPAGVVRALSGPSYFVDRSHYMRVILGNDYDFEYKIIKRSNRTPLELSPGQHLYGYFAAATGGSAINPALKVELTPLSGGRGFLGTVAGAAITTYLTALAGQSVVEVIEIPGGTLRREREVDVVAASS